MTTLYRKYRPKTFADVVGQTHIVTTLTNALTSDKVGQAYLFTGPRGTGKTTLARIFAKAINCLDRKKSEPCGKCAHCVQMEEGRSLDIIEIDAASHTGVDNIRELRETIALPPTLGKRKIYIIDEVHMLSIGAFNALLKTLEEPPSHVMFILATTALHKVPDTIVSRCQRFDLGRFPVASIIEKLERIAKEEKISIEPGALNQIALASEGGMRDAESLLTQIYSLEVKKITEDIVIDVLGTAKHETYAELFRDIQSGHLLDALTHVRKLGDEGRDFRVLVTGFMHFLRDLLLFTATTEVPSLLRSTLTKEQVDTFTALSKEIQSLDVVKLLEILVAAQKESSQAVIPELPLEIALVRMIDTLGTKSASSPTPPAPKSPVAIEKKTPVAPKTTPVAEAEFIEASQTAKEVPKISPAPVIKETPITQEAAMIPEVIDDAVSLTLAQFSENWTQIQRVAKDLNASLTLALSTAIPKSVEKNVVTIGVKYPFHKERLMDKANQLTLLEAFDRILGLKLGLKIELEEEGAKTEEVPASENPLISQALNLLGGTMTT
ncbi:MAG: DNA polymerase III subunit gamma/tau [Candidatus Moranbacteria bacterium]|nr:DNA polymerase III subunit gamma/tau [Candidatus Moranbacteria bacterium]